MSRVAAQLEKKGMPVVLESFKDEGINITAKQNFMREGVPMVREVLTPQDTSLKEFPDAARYWKEEFRPAIDFTNRCCWSRHRPSVVCSTALQYLNNSILETHKSFTFVV